jgi:hypothetical protein
MTSSIAPARNMTETLSRKLVFDKPPPAVRDEVLGDSIIDEWEQSVSCQALKNEPNHDYDSLLSQECARENYKPLIGILT